MKKEEGFIFPVVCSNCAKVFDFASHLEESDSDKHIAQIVLEKCGGDNILCKDCIINSSSILNEGKFRWKSRGFGKEKSINLELESKTGEKRTLRAKKVKQKSIIFELSED